MKNLVTRKCIGCQTLKNREELIKITLYEGDLIINPNSKTFGRSCYVCRDIECIKKMIKSKGIKRALKYNNDVVIQGVHNKLLEEFSGSN